MKLLCITIILFTSVISMNTYANVCNITGKITALTPSAAITGFNIDTPLTGCSCDYSAIWINVSTDGGKAMYSAVLSAKMADKTVQVTIEDGKGQGAPGNGSVTYRYWPTCQLFAVDVY